MSMKQAGKDLFAEFKKDDWAPFVRYQVCLHLSNIVGGTPKNSQLIDAWIGAKNKELSAQEREKLANATKEELGELSNNAAENNCTGFRRNSDGLFIEGRQIKAMLKESANIIKNIVPGGRKPKGQGGGEAPGITNLKSKVAERLFVLEDQISLGKKKPDAIEEKPIHVMTAMGPRDSIKRCEVVNDVVIAFTLQRHRGSEVPEKTMLAILDYAQTMGLGADRSQGRGQFKVLGVERLTE